MLIIAAGSSSSCRRFSPTRIPPSSGRNLVGWGLETGAETLLRTVPAVVEPNAADAQQVCQSVRCPVLILHGEHDGIVPYEIGVALARWTGGSMVTIPGGGHAPTIRDPVRTNLLLHDFAASLAPPRPRRMEWTPARTRRRRALFVPSAIGLGHARRDVAVATELRALHHDLEVHWLAQHPVTEVLAEQHEWVHPASRWLASECAHIEAESGEHDLHAFQAIRRMDEIQVANFHVFHELIDAEPYDLVVADEGWEIDYFLHENPELKRCPFVWLTDFVGWLPMPDERGGGSGANCGLQRGDDRTHRPVPPTARPLSLRRHRRRSGDRSPWPRPANRS